MDGLRANESQREIKSHDYGKEISSNEEWVVGLEIIRRVLSRQMTCIYHTTLLNCQIAKFVVHINILIYIICIYIYYMNICADDIYHIYKFQILQSRIPPMVCIWVL